MGIKTNTLETTSTASDSIKTAGGVQVAKRVIIDDTTEATTTTDGSLQTDGGLSVAKNAVVGGAIESVQGDGRILGKVLTPTSADGAISIIDTGIMVGTSAYYSAIFEVAVQANPSSGGSSAYRATAFYHVHINTGFNFGESQLTTRINETLLSKFAGGPSVTDVTIEAKLWDGSSEQTSRVRTDLDQMRIRVTGSSTVGSGVSIRVRRIL